MKLSGTVALVTGGAKRVGRAIAIELAEAGCDVAIHYHRSRLDAEQLVAEIVNTGRRAVTISADLDDHRTWPQVIQQTVDSLQRLDILVNNASSFRTDQTDSAAVFEHETWESTMRINLIAPMALSHYARPHLASHGSGRIINLGDIAAERPWPNHLAYCTSKAALTTLTKGLARALAPRIRVNAVAPGIAVFPDDYPAELREKLVDRVPLREAGTPEGVARLVRFLVESGDYITGQIIPIDGGRSIV